MVKIYMDTVHTGQDVHKRNETERKMIHNQTPQKSWDRVEVKAKNNLKGKNPLKFFL
jgi:hypothetical protein